MSTLLELNPRGSRVTRNEAKNPRFATNIDSWTAPAGSKNTRVAEGSAWAVKWEATAVGIPSQAIAFVTPNQGKMGRYYGARFKMRRGSSLPVDAKFSPRIFDGTRFITSVNLVMPTVELTEYVILSDTPSAKTALDALSFRIYPATSGGAQNWAIGDSVIFTDVIFGEVTGYGMAPEKFFDGGTPAAAGATYAWNGVGNLSSSTETLTPHPDTVTTAIFAIGYEATRVVRSIVHEVPNAPSSPVTFKPAGPRSGTIEYLFETRDECRRAEIIHTQVGYVILTDVDWPGSLMRYVPQDEVTTTLDPETRVRWILSTGFVEVPW